jgi:hypothetical protein
VLVALAAAVPTAENLHLRAPLVPATVPRVYDVIANDPDPAALVELPAGGLDRRFALFSSRYMFNQTYHGKFMLDGTISRFPLGRPRFVSRSIEDFATLPYVKYVVVHRDLLAEAREDGRRQAEQIRAVAARQGRIVANDDAIDIYRLDTFRPGSVCFPCPRAAADVGG